jgi:GntR family transcriptional regulator
MKNAQNNGVIPLTDEPSPGQSRYGWLAAGLRSRILQGEWMPGEALPPESLLAKSYGVALGTLRQALALLVSEGLLERFHGRGTFVKAGIGGATMMRFFRFRQGSDHHAVPASKILRVNRRLASVDEAGALGQPAGSNVLEVDRVRSLDGSPCLLEHLILSLPTFDALSDSDKSAWGDLLYPMYQSACGVVIHHAEDQLSFDLLTKSQSKKLALTEGHPCVRVQRKAFDMRDQVVELRTTLGDAFAFQYTAQVR